MKDNLKILSYNIWFGKYENEKRMIGLGNILKAEKADIIALQEVTLELWQLLLLHCKNLFQDYTISSAPGLLGGYYTMLLIHHHLNCTNMIREEFDDGYQDRDLLSSKITLKTSQGDIKVSIATAHLESLSENKRIRARQFKYCLNTLSENIEKTSECIFMGDMNMPDQDEAEPILAQEEYKHYQDAWLALGKTHEDGYTYDNDQNFMEKYLIRNFHQPLIRYRSRLDRFFCRTTHFKIQDMYMIGVNKIEEESIENNHQYIYPSDHYGIVLLLHLSSNK